jgi:DNA-directed RNA polymerase specialized sigma subunit
VIGRIYNTLKQNPVLNLKPFQSGENGEGVEDREEKFTSLKGSDATARAVAKETVVSWRTIHADAPKGRKMCKICTFSLRRNLTDSQRTEVIGRIYNTKKMAQGRPRKDEKEVNLTSFSGSDATAKEVAKEVGVSEATVRRAGKFAEAVAALERISPKAAERVLRGEVRDASPSLRQCGQALC